MSKVGLEQGHVWFVSELASVLVSVSDMQECSGRFSKYKPDPPKLLSLQAIDVIRYVTISLRDMLTIRVHITKPTGSLLFFP